MDEESNTLIIRTGYENFAAGNISDLVEHFADDVELHAPEVENSPYGGIWHGRAAVEAYFHLLMETEDITDFEAREYIAKDDRVIVLGRWTSTVRATGRHYSTDWVHIHTLKNGKITTFSYYFDTAAALRAFQKATKALT